MSVFDGIKKMISQGRKARQTPKQVRGDNGSARGGGRLKSAAAESAPRAFLRHSAPASPWSRETWDGEKFGGSFGLTKIFDEIDYWTLRRRSFQIFTENPYALGIVRRIVHNEIFTGLTANSSPDGDVLWPHLDEMAAADEAMKFGDEITRQFALYAGDRDLFDFKGLRTFGEFQELVRLESMLSGDGIVVARIGARSLLPCFEWIRGDFVQTSPDYSPPDGNRVIDGVEIDADGRHVAYFVQKEGAEGGIEYERIPVFGAKSGRRVAWMVFGSEKMSDTMRGQPILANLLTMFKEIDRYKDAELRSAVLNALIPYTVQKEMARDDNSALQQAMRRATGRGDAAQVSQGAVEADGRRPAFCFASPGTVPDDLGPGEKVVSFQSAHPNVNFVTFADAIIDAMCWSLEIPPEIVRLKFESSYSASRQANNEFEIYLKRRIWKNANDFCQPVFEEFVISAAAAGFLKIPGILQVCANPKKWRERRAWLSCAWSGISRPSVDPVKDVTAAKGALDAGLTTMDDECRRLNGKSFRQTMHILVREVDYAKKLGFTPNFLENNNGEPVELAGEGSAADGAEEKQGA